MAPSQNLALQISRTRHADWRVHETVLPELGAGQVRFRIERFGKQIDLPIGLSGKHVAKLHGKKAAGGFGAAIVPNLLSDRSWKRVHDVQQNLNF